MPIVSVIVPVYNVEEYLDECLSSIVNQSLYDIEVICIDDGSNDSSLKILKSWEKRDQRITVYSQSNSGQSVARNYGVNVSKGKYIYFIDSDDILEERALEVLVNELESRELELLFFNGKSFSEEDVHSHIVERYKIFYTRKNSYDLIYTGVDFFYNTYSNGDFLPSPCFQIARKDFLIKNNIKFLPRVLHEDELYTFSELLFANRVGYIPDVLYNRRLRANSVMTTQGLFKNVYGYFRVSIEMIELLDEICEEKLNFDYQVKIKEFIKNRIKAACNRYMELSDCEKNKYLKLSLKEKTQFEVFVINTLYPQGKDREIIFYKQELENIKNGYSFRIGRIITWLPRKIKGGIKCYKEHGLVYTINRLLFHLKLK